MQLDVPRGAPAPDREQGVVTEELLHPPWHDVSRPLCVKEADSSDETDKETEKANRVVQGMITVSWCFEPLAAAELDPPEPPPGAEDTQDGPLHP